MPLEISSLTGRMTHRALNSLFDKLVTALDREETALHAFLDASSQRSDDPVAALQAWMKRQAETMAFSHLLRQTVSIPTLRSADTTVDARQTPLDGQLDKTPVPRAAGHALIADAGQCTTAGRIWQADKEKIFEDIDNCVTSGESYIRRSLQVVDDSIEACEVLRAIIPWPKLHIRKAGEARRAYATLLHHSYMGKFLAGSEKLQSELSTYTGWRWDYDGTLVSQAEWRGRRRSD